jgi:hypothetical protein
MITLALAALLALVPIVPPTSPPTGWVFFVWYAPGSDLWERFHSSGEGEPDGVWHYDSRVGCEKNLAIARAHSDVTWTSNCVEVKPVSKETL